LFPTEAATIELTKRAVKGTMPTGLFIKIINVIIVKCFVSSPGSSIRRTMIVVATTLVVFITTLDLS
jgi:hypothetical protein